MSSTPGISWLTIMTFSRTKGAEMFLEHFKDHVTFGTTGKVVIFSEEDPDVVFHLVGKAMEKFSLMTFTVNKIRTPHD